MSGKKLLTLISLIIVISVFYFGIDKFKNMNKNVIYTKKDIEEMVNSRTTSIIGIARNINDISGKKRAAIDVSVGDINFGNDGGDKRESMAVITVVIKNRLPWSDSTLGKIVSVAGKLNFGKTSQDSGWSYSIIDIDIEPQLENESAIKVISYNQLAGLIGHNIVVVGETLNDNIYGGENDDPEDDSALLVPVIEVHLIDDRNPPDRLSDDLDFVVRFRLEKGDLWTEDEEGELFTISGIYNNESILDRDNNGQIYTKETIHFLNEPLKIEINK